MISLADRVRETTTTTGTGTVDLGGAATGYQTFVDGAGDGAEVYYCIVGGSEWETGIGTVTDAATDTLSRDTVLDSSNSGSLVNFSAGNKDVFLTVPAAALSGVAYSPSAVSELDIDIAGYDRVRIVGYLLPATDNVAFWLLLSDDGGVTFEADAADYGWGDVQWNMSTGGQAENQDASDSQMAGYASYGNAAGEGLHFNLEISMLDQSAYQTFIQGFTIGYKTDGVPVHGFRNSMTKVAAVNDAVRLKFSSGNIASGRVTVYGSPAA